jgi:hypothetical protein
MIESCKKWGRLAPGPREPAHPKELSCQQLEDLRLLLYLKAPLK